MRKSPFIALAALFCSLTAAQAAPPQMEVDALMKPDGNLDACRASSDYTDGKKLTLALKPDTSLDIIATIPNAGLQAGRKYDLTLTLDDANPRRIRAQAVDAETISLALGINPAFRTALSGSKQLALAAAAGQPMTFPLPAIAGAMKQLKFCLDQNKTAETIQPHPAAAAAPEPKEVLTPPPAAKQQQPKQPAKAAQQPATDFPEQLAQLLTDAGVGPVEPVPMDDIPEAQRPADYIWAAGKILGGVRERSVPKGHNLSELIGIHTQGLKNKCPGAFRVDINKEQKAGSLTLRTALATCAPPEGAKGDTILVGMMFYLTKKNVFTVFTHEGPQKLKKEVLTARDKLADFMLKLGREER